ncbi:hypothetical protein EJ02DRAFT_139965 [Clathrospora elynae]|uniref:Uncharacterized protein n=1 Tax=Clathrospora elynae TaxID=706981 RepID=A0A6A5T2X3_9PLEO|nr:hypothetical protein EJ02DRAFT_139965 [Clathrospora elynae]
MPSCCDASQQKPSYSSAVGHHDHCRLSEKCMFTLQVMPIKVGENGSKRVSQGLESHVPAEIVFATLSWRRFMVALAFFGASIAVTLEIPT